jgi:hypothetical protein
MDASLLTPLASLLEELRGLLHAHAADYLPYFLFYCALAEVFGRLLPALYPSIYDFTAAKAARDGVPLPKNAEALAAARGRLAVAMRAAAVASTMAVHVSAGALYGLLSPGIAGALRHSLEAEVPLTRHLVNVAVGFFLWDLVYCFDSAVFVVHGVACLAVFAGSLRPFLHHMAMVTLLFEASTPLLHLRRIMIDSDAVRTSAWYPLVNDLFSATFFASRIAHGLWACAQWWGEVEAALASGALAPSRAPMVRMYQVLCCLLSGLNIYWFTFKIAPNYLFPRKPRGGGSKEA